ncbi:MAG TPA: acyl-CoA dehydrogenase family protein [Mycobacteriales bacterium]|jgi:alkylation response protein AidB-like acyl-CoA dehydrogenase|nr:acyl-CoA dehydrogenase family protein [Mycobacteriales bacterium]
MYFLPTEQQSELQRGVREVLEAAYPLDKLSGGFDAAVWASLVETGVFSLRTELELGWVEAVLVFEELGRSALPGPLVGTFLAAGYAEGPVTVLDRTRTPLLAPHLDIAESVLLLDSDAAYTISPPPGVALPEPIDPLTPLYEVDGTESIATGSTGPDAVRFDVGVEQVRLAGALLTAALQVGLSQRLLELAVDYAKSREQFERPIGSFQAVKHICADMLVRTELARASLHAAAVTLDDPEVGDATRAVSGAKQLADEAACGNARSCVQVHGGMGFTWEVPVHYFLKRAWLHATEFGTADEHAEALAQLL